MELMIAIVSLVKISSKYVQLTVSLFLQLFHDRWDKESIAEALGTLLEVSTHASIFSYIN